MEKRKFEIGSRYFYSGLYGGQYTVEVVSRTETAVTFREYWIAEDTGKECHTDVERDVEVVTLIDRDVQVERVNIWEYSRDKGYLYCVEDDESFFLEAGDDEYDEDFCDWEEKSYGPSNPWDAPGMKISDFITGVSYW